MCQYFVPLYFLSINIDICDSQWQNEPWNPFYSETWQNQRHIRWKLVERPVWTPQSIHSLDLFWRKTRYFVRLVKLCHFLIVGKKRNSCLICGGSVRTPEPPTCSAWWRTECTTQPYLCGNAWPRMLMWHRRKISIDGEKGKERNKVWR